MRSLVISAISKRLGRSSNLRNFPALICGQSMPHTCHGDYLEIPLYVLLHSLGFQELYSIGSFSCGNNLYEERRVYKIGFFRAISTEAMATEKIADEEKEEKEDSSKGLPNSLYRRITILGDPKRSAVAALEGWIKEGKKHPKKREIKRMVKELRKYSRHQHALESLNWGFADF